MSKNIIFCADGTWNGPDLDENDDGIFDWTNVYKLFLNLDGTLSSESIRLADEQEKQVVDGAMVVQVAKHLHGVGDSRNPILKLLGGAFGTGLVARIVRGYTFISRHYQPNDKISLLGFSRGAYTARALGGLIASQGLLRSDLAQDKELAYLWGAAAWYRFRMSKESKASSLARLVEVVADFPASVSSAAAKDTDFIPIDRIAAIGVWDTVGALGIPEYVGGRRADAFRFADTSLSSKVTAGFHAVSLDERRSDFSPTLWEPAARVTQVLFPGAHADVGGGYPTSGGESGLSDVALVWMTEQLKGVGALFSARSDYAPVPSPAGTAHEPWAHGLWKQSSRRFPAGMPQDPSIAARMAAGRVVADPGEAPAVYKPENLPGPARARPHAGVSARPATLGSATQPGGM